jgi:glycerol-3-phosphate O-acyltransferase/dihydroxyacetone phosphate acyltransferase
VRRLVVAFAALLLRGFFRRIEMSHAERLPATGPVVYVLNHPNGLVDPLFILVYAGRPVSFLAKEPLFHMFFIGWCLRQLDALPVYRLKDNADPKQNRKTFDDARALLLRGGSIALFPEGTSHSDPALKPLKTGAARIALGAAALPESLPLRIVPVGLTYSRKQTFRSEALVCVGEPFDCPHVEVPESGEPPADPVHALTDRIAAALERVTLHAERLETLRAIAFAHRVFTAEGEEGKADLAQTLELERRIANAEATLRPKDPELVREITERVLAHGEALEALGVDEHRLTPERLSFGFLGRRLAMSLLWLPFSLLALAGALVALVPYRVTSLLARKASGGEDDELATVKMLSAALLYPVSWLVFAALAAAWRGPLAGAITLVACPALCALALTFRERLRGLIGTLRAVGLWIFRRQAVEELVAERRALRDLMRSIAESLSV